MIDIYKILMNLKYDLYTNLRKNNEDSFFYTSFLHLAISLEIGIHTYDENFISYEKICLNIPRKLGSRSTIQTILNDAVKLGYFEKTISAKDRRVKHYKLSKKFNIILEKYIENKNKILTNN